MGMKVINLPGKDLFFQSQPLVIGYQTLAIRQRRWLSVIAHRLFAAGAGYRASVIRRKRYRHRLD